MLLKKKQQCVVCSGIISSWGYIKTDINKSKNWNGIFRQVML